MSYLSKPPQTTSQTRETLAEVYLKGSWRLFTQRGIATSKVTKVIEVRGRKLPKGNRHIGWLLTNEGETISLHEFVTAIDEGILRKES